MIGSGRNTDRPVAARPTRGLMTSSGTRWFFILGVFAMNPSGGHGQTTDMPAIDMRVDWAGFLARQDPIWERLPERFDDGAFLGNGLMGATIYRDGDRRFRWEMGRSDVTEHRRDNARLPIGGLVLTTVGKIQGGAMRLDLWNAEVRGEIKTDKGSVSFVSFIHTGEMALFTNIETTGDERNAEFAWEAHPATDRANKQPAGQANPPARTETLDGITLCNQQRFAGGAFATAWSAAATGNHRRVVLSIADSFPDNTAAAEAIATVRKNPAADDDGLLQSHRAWWHGFYPKSLISIPDPKTESFYWIQLYKLASASRPDHVPVDLLGPWYRPTGWPRIWWNLNIETLYLPVYTGNHLELGESFINFLDKKRANFFRNAKEIWKFDECATVPHTTDCEGLRGDGTLAPDGYINPGDFTWALHNYYLHYRHSMDERMITDQNAHGFYQLLRGSVNLYLHLLKKGEDNKLHLPVLHSPEYGNDADNNYNLALLRWGCRTLIDLNLRFPKLNDPLIPAWKETLENLVSYPVDENGLRIGANLAFAKSHRHWSHMLMIHPLHIMTDDRAEDRDLISRSIRHWLSVEDGREVFGWSRAAAASLYATLGDGRNAIDQIHRHMADARFVRPNTQYIEGDPVIECSIVLNRSLQDMLLQSWGDKINVFPAMPKEWDSAVFHDLRAEGAFLISAERKAGRTLWVRVKSLAGEPCRIKPGVAGDIKVASQGNRVALKGLGNGVYELGLSKGEEALLYAGPVVPAIVIAPVPADPGECNAWGIKIANRNSR